MISVVVLTLNEEVNLEACLKSVMWSDDIVVVDSFSLDKSVEIARELGARVIQRKWEGEWDQRTASLRVKFKHPWVYNPDADEVTPPELSEEMRGVVADPTRPEVAYRVRFRHMFMGQWIKRSSLYPTWVIRLFRPEKVTFERSVNLRYVVDGPIGVLRNHFEHYPFNKGLDAWIDKHNKYSRYEAHEAVMRSVDGVKWRRMMTLDPVRRREALKALSLTLPCRPALRFLYGYILRRGFLDGRPGLIYCGLMAWYEWMIDLKRRESQRGIGAQRR